MGAYADVFAPVAQHVWTHRTAVINGTKHHILVFNYEKLGKAGQSDLLSGFQLESLTGYAKLAGGGHKWTHTKHVPFALASTDPDPFVVDDKSISGAYGPVNWFLMLDVETGDVVGVDISEGYVAEEGAKVERIAKSVADLQLADGSTL